MLRDITLRHAITSLLSLGAIGIAGLAAAGEADEPRLAALQQQLTQVQTQLQQLARENRSLRAGQHQLERRLAELAGAPGAVPVAAAPPPGAAEASQALPASPSALPGPATGEGPRLWGYGEVYFADPTRDGRRSQADLARGVFGLGYSFDERTEFNSEFEVEHAVASASDVGEFEVEQFYVDRRLGDSVSARGGLFLMPFGLLNEHHEPTRYYGVQRNFVETLIIPSTWREGGVSLRGDTPLGLGWNLGLTTGFDLSKWQFDQTFPAYASALALANSGVAPLQATHQELALANARHLTQYAAVSYYGVPALEVGGAISTGKAVGIPLTAGSSTAQPDPRITLWEAHGRWTPGKLDLSALYARGSISDLAAANAAHQLSGSPGDVGYWPASHDRVWTAGANLYLGTHVVLKGDYQWFRLNSSFNRFDLGLGVSF